MQEQGICVFVKIQKKSVGDKRVCLVAREGGSEPRMMLWARDKGMVVTAWVCFSSGLLESHIFPQTVVNERELESSLYYLSATNWWNHRMVCVGRTFKNHSALTSQPWAGDTFQYSKLHPG